MCKKCPVKGCEVLIVGERDICRRHLEQLPKTSRERIEQLRDAVEANAARRAGARLIQVTEATSTAAAIRYRAELAAAVDILSGAMPIKTGGSAAAATGTAGPRTA